MHYLIVLFASFICATITAFIEWLFIYRTDSYIELTEEIEKLNKKLKIAKEKKHTKKIDAYDEAIKECNRNMASVRFKSMFATGIVMFSLLGFLNSMYELYDENIINSIDLILLL